MNGPVDVNVFVGAYPFRKVPGTTPDAVRESLDRAGTRQAWVTHLPGLFWRDPTEGNPWLYDLCSRQRDFLPVPCIHPGLANWRTVLADAAARKVPALRCDPHLLGLDPAGEAMRALAGAAAESGLPVLMAVKLEDSRQRHPHDGFPDLAPSAVRALVRSNPHARFVITHADRGFIEEVHFGSTPEEAARLSWDISWIWGPPEDHLRLLVRTIGAARFVFGTGTPLRLAEVAAARLDLSDLDPADRFAIEQGNAQALARR